MKTRRKSALTPALSPEERETDCGALEKLQRSEISLRLTHVYGTPLEWTGRFDPAKARRVFLPVLGERAGVRAVVPPFCSPFRQGCSIG